MKKKALLIFTLIFWLVGACTFLSMKVEQEMIPQVTAVEPDRGVGWDKDPTLPQTALLRTKTASTSTAYTRAPAGRPGPGRQRSAAGFRWRTR